MQFGSIEVAGISVVILHYVRQSEGCKKSDDRNWICYSMEEFIASILV